MNSNRCRVRVLIIRSIRVGGTIPLSDICPKRMCYTITSNGNTGVITNETRCTIWIPKIIALRWI